MEMGHEKQPLVELIACRRRTTVVAAASANGRTDGRDRGGGVEKEVDNEDGMQR